MELLNSVLPKTRAPSSYTRLWHIPSCSQTTNCTRFLTLTDPFAPLSTKNYSDFLCSKLSSHSPLGHFFFFNHWKLFRIPTCELFESKLLDSFFWTKAGATRHPSYSTSTPLEKNSVLWIVGCLLWSLPAGFLACQLEKYRYYVYTAFISIYKISLWSCEVVFFFLSFPFFHSWTCWSNCNHQPVNTKVGSQFLMGEVGGVPIKLVWLPEDSWLPQF